MNKWIKTFLAALLLLALIPSVFSAHAEYLADFSEEELRRLITDARKALSNLVEETEKGSIVYEDEYVKITFSSFELSKSNTLSMKCVCENKTDRNLVVNMENISLNGWDLASSFGVHVSVTASSKSKDSFSFFDITDDTDITSVDEIEELRYIIKVRDDDTNKRLVDSNTYYTLDFHFPD